MKYADWKAVYIDKTKTLEEWRNAKDAEYAAQSKAKSFKTAPHGIAPSGNLLFKRQAHFSTSDENVLATNPNFNLGRQFQINCQKCVPAYEIRMRGYDVMARPTFDLVTDSFAKDNWTEAFENVHIEENLTGTGKKLYQETYGRMGRWCKSRNLRWLGF